MTVDLERSAWLERRKLGVGGSDIGALLGLSNWSSPWSLYCEKVGLLPPSPMTERQQIGHDAEVFLAGIFRRRTGLEVAGEQMEVCHLKHTFARATLDGIVTDPSGAWLGTIQFKTTAERSWKDGIPPAILAQCQWEMGVAGLPRCWLVVGFAGWNIEVLDLAFDPEDWTFMLARAADFWQHVTEGRPPDIDGSDATSAALKVVYATGLPDGSILLDHIYDDIKRRAMLAKLISDMDKEVKAIKNRVCAELGSAEIGTLGDQIAATWTKQGGRKTTCSACGHVDQGDDHRVLRFKSIKE